MTTHKEVANLIESLEDTYSASVMPRTHIVIRLDGRGFSRLTKRENPLNLNVPFDKMFHDIMVDAAMYLFDAIGDVVFGYTQSDEISILLKRDTEFFARRVFKLASVSSSEASSFVSVRIDRPVAFDARVIPIPDRAVVPKYFRYRQEDANRNALISYVYWSLREEGYSPKVANAQMVAFNRKLKIEYLKEKGIDFDNIPQWQKAGSAVLWGVYKKTGYNPITGEKVVVKRNKIVCDYTLPVQDEFEEYVETNAF